MKCKCGALMDTVIGYDGREGDDVVTVAWCLHCGRLWRHMAGCDGCWLTPDQWYDGPDEAEVADE